MNPVDLSVKLAEEIPLLGAFHELMQKADRPAAEAGKLSRRAYDRICKRGVAILRVLRDEDPKCYDDLQFVGRHTANWAFLYAQSGTPIKECASLLKREVRQTTKSDPYQVGSCGVVPKEVWFNVPCLFNGHLVVNSPVVRYPNRPPVGNYPKGYGWKMDAAGDWHLHNVTGIECVATDLDAGNRGDSN